MAPKFAEELETIGAHEAEIGIKQNKEDQEGGSPVAPVPNPRILAPTGEPGDLPQALVHDDNYVCGRDRKAARKRNRRL
jgi:hypothetical protein